MFKHIVKGWKTIGFLNSTFLNKYKDDYLFFSDTRAQERQLESAILCHFIFSILIEGLVKVL